MSFQTSYYTCYNAPIGNLLLVGNDNGLSKLSLLSDNDKGALLKEDALEENHAYFQNVCLQLSEYFSGARKNFTLKTNPSGTAFQKTVWKALQTIPYGSTCSYQDIANEINNPKAVRAIGRANGLNPIPFIIPCHRVIGASGKLTGYAYGLPLKAKLLTLESAAFIPE